MQYTRFLVVAKILFLMWPVAWCVFIRAPGWTAAFSQIPMLLLCALSAGLSLGVRSKDTLSRLNVIMATISAMAAATVTIYLISSILLRCDSVMTTFGDPVFSVACIDERNLIWALAFTGALVALLDIIYIAVLYYTTRRVAW